MSLSLRLCSLILLLAAGQLQPTTARAQSAASPASQSASIKAIDAMGPNAVTAQGAAKAMPSAESAATTVPAMLTNSSSLEQPIADLAQALTKYVEKKVEPEKLTTTIGDLLQKLGALVGAIVAAYGAYKASKKIPWFKEHKELVATVVTTGCLVVLFYVLSGIVTSVLSLLIAIIVLLIALAVAVAHLLAFIDEKYPDVRDSILSSFFESNGSKSAHKLVRNNTRGINEWLSNVLFVQILSGEIELVLRGAFAEGFDESIFRIHPLDRLTAHWHNVDDRMLIPVGTSILLRDSNSGSEAEVINIQMGLIVVRIGEILHFKKFSADGWQLLGASLMNQQLVKVKAVLEEQQKIASNNTVFNSQAL